MGRRLEPALSWVAAAQAALVLSCSAPAESRPVDAWVTSFGGPASTADGSSGDSDGEGDGSESGTVTDSASSSATMPTSGGGPDGSSDGTDSGPGPASGADDTGADDDYSGPYAMERKLCVDLNNMLRTQNGVPALTRFAEKEPCVDMQAEQESLIDTPHGKLGLCSELRQNHGDGTGWENLELIDWLINDQFGEGPGGPHYEQMMDPNMTLIACGFYQNPNGNFWINIDFW